MMHPPWFWPALVAVNTATLAGNVLIRNWGMVAVSALGLATSVFGLLTKLGQRP